MATSCLSTSTSSIQAPQQELTSTDMSRCNSLALMSTPGSGPEGDDLMSLLGPAGSADEERQRAVDDALATIPAAVALTPAGCLAADAVTSAATQAFDACLDAAAAADPTGVCTNAGPSPDVVADAICRYDQGPCAAVTSFPACLEEARGICEEPGSASVVSAEEAQRATELYAKRNRLSVLAFRIQQSSSITLAGRHPSGNSDHATPQHNVADMVAGVPPGRSSYSGAPGGTVEANEEMLSALERLTQPPYNFEVQVTELAGGKHSGGAEEVRQGRGSRHYHGEAFDIGMINGKVANAANPATRKLMRACEALGATLVLGPGDPNHDTHVHAEWRP
jgi:hypothetical protein